MKRVPLAACLLLLSHMGTPAQQGQPDSCHVYVIDQKVTEKAFGKWLASKDENEREALLTAGVTILGEFFTEHGEEKLTTRAFRFPGSKLFVTASVFYTDEIMPTKHGASMLLGITVSGKPREAAFDVQHNAISEVPDTFELDIVRVKQNVKVGGRPYLVGLQCDRKRKDAAKR